eukprot:CAMPEP_0194032466 /NCGR_PEP_ID=MMETSP0009_2-20130614/5399_1 /TAXON_ID=210454 /ORGANISM="Grammatophora oceanica, Strain CCMP 410" /LENGTH=57 /DNA_ID=CAMNT_0038672913 /DNA_START=33 /DNA_END=206 /DNA_ORIENTATION=+
MPTPEAPTEGDVTEEPAAEESSSDATMTTTSSEEGSSPTESEPETPSGGVSDLYGSP